MESTAYTYEHQPTRLLEGALLGTIAHAIWVAADPGLAGMQEWVGTTYVLNDFSGTHGAVDFSTLTGAPQLVAAFATVEAGVDRGRPAEAFFRAAPRARQAQVKEALALMLYERGGELRPLITAALWSADGHLEGPDPWSETWRAGAHLLAKQLLAPEEAVIAWQADYALTDRETKTLRALFKRRRREPHFTADPTIADVLGARGGKGLSEAVGLLEAIGIVVVE